MVSKVWKFRIKLQLFWAQEGICHLCDREMPHPEDCSNPMLAVVADYVQARSLGFGYRKNYLVSHRMCNERKGVREPTAAELDYLTEINNRLRRFIGWSWTEIEAFLRVQPCFLRFAARAELARKQERTDADHERTAPRRQVSSES